MKSSDLALSNVQGAHLLSEENLLAVVLSPPTPRPVSAGKAGNSTWLLSALSN